MRKVSDMPDGVNGSEPPYGAWCSMFRLYCWGQTMPQPRNSSGKTSIDVQCRLFGRYAELTGCDQLTLALTEGATVTDALSAVRAQVSEAALLPERPLTAINRKHVQPDAVLNDGDELAILPPLAGG